MAQTRRRRQTKHRGNAAGVVESRGRTGRKPTAEEKSPVARQKSLTREQRLREREDRAPTWRGSLLRAMFAAILLLAVLLLFKIGNPNAAIALFPILIVVYWPVSYYSERWVYNRRQRAKAARPGKGGR
jgi:hypothetical protein